MSSIIHTLFKSLQSVLIVRQKLNKTHAFVNVHLETYFISINYILTSTLHVSMCKTPRVIFVCPDNGLINVARPGSRPTPFRRLPPVSAELANIHDLTDSFENIRVNILLFIHFWTFKDSKFFQSSIMFVESIKRDAWTKWRNKKLHYSLK